MRFNNVWMRSTVTDLSDEPSKRSIHSAMHDSRQAYASYHQPLPPATRMPDRVRPSTSDTGAMSAASLVHRVPTVCGDIPQQQASASGHPQWMAVDQLRNVRCLRARPTPLHDVEPQASPTQLGHFSPITATTAQPLPRPRLTSLRELNPS